MKQVASILFLLLFSFAGVVNMQHHLEAEADHCDELNNHFCSVEGHHSCAL